MTERTKSKKRKNRAIVAKYLALFFDNTDKKKCLVTFTGNDQTHSGAYKNINAIKTAFIDKTKSILKRKAYQGSSFSFFAVMESGKDYQQYFNPHLHIQCYYEHITAIQEAFDFVIKKFGLDRSKCDISIADKQDATFNYIVKTFLSSNFNMDYEYFKTSLARKKPMYWSSHKATPNYLIKKLYTLLSKLPIWKAAKDKYELIATLINNGSLMLKKINSSAIKGFKRVKRWSYKLINISTSLKTSPYKIISMSGCKSKLNLFCLESVILNLIFIWHLIIKPQKFPICWDIREKNELTIFLKECHPLNLAINFPHQQKGTK